MAFWGVEVKPGKAITHSLKNGGGRLRISQATLGFGEASKKSVLQCNVGNRRPVLLCVLLPEKTESCPLDLEFEEKHDVVFSVIGPRSVYLTGYYVRQNENEELSPSYGENISQSDGSSDSSDEDGDSYESSFVVSDDELEAYPQIPVLSDHGMDEDMLENNSPKDRIGRVNHLRKNYRVIESDDANLQESEEDGSLSLFESKRAVLATMSYAAENIARVNLENDDEAKDDGSCGSELKENVDLLALNGKLERETKPPLDEVKTDFNEKNEYPEELVSADKIVVSDQSINHGIAKKHTMINWNLPVSNEEDQMQSIDLEKPKKKRKELSVLEEKTSNLLTDNEDHFVHGDDKEPEVEVTANVDVGENYLATPLDLGSGQNLKRRKDESSGHAEQSHNFPKTGTFDQGLLNAVSIFKDQTAANGDCEKQRSGETSMEGIGAKSQNIPTQDEVTYDRHADSRIVDLLEANGQNQEQIDNNISVSSQFLATDNQHEKKTKKSKKTQVKRDLNMAVTKMTDNKEATPMEYEEQNTGAGTGSIQKRTLSNGLIIEELASGPPDGKVAAPGKKVKIYYTGMLKDNEHVFDSNVGKAVFSFRLGCEELIDGWNIGIDGMHVGDKRRLIIPPSLGFGDQGFREIVPPNSWIVYDVELVGVRK